MSARFVARALGPFAYEIRDTSTGYNTCDLYVGVDARQRAETRAATLNAKDADGGEPR